MLGLCQVYLFAQTTGIICVQFVCYGNWCSSDQLGGTERVHLSPICSDMSLHAEDQNKEVHSGADSPMLENPTLVPSPVETASICTNPAAWVQEPTPQKTLCVAISGDNMLQFLRKLQNCWPQAGAKVHQLGWVWVLLGGNWSYSLWGPSLSRFLTCFKWGLQCYLLDVIRLVVWIPHAILEGSPIGQHPLVSQLLVGFVSQVAIWETNFADNFNPG